MISFDQFKQLDLRVAKILEATPVESSDKLILLKVNIGEGERQIVAGIGNYYNPEQLIGKNIIVVANLEPKMLMGKESQGMLLAAVKDNGEPVLIIPENDVPPGTKVS